MDSSNSSIINNLYTKYSIEQLELDASGRGTLNKSNLRQLYTYNLSFPPLVCQLGSIVKLEPGVSTFFFERLYFCQVGQICSLWVFHLPDQMSVKVLTFSCYFVPAAGEKKISSWQQPKHFLMLIRPFSKFSFSSITQYFWTGKFTVKCWDYF